MSWKQLWRLIANEAHFRQLLTCLLLSLFVASIPSRCNLVTSSTDNIRVKGMQLPLILSLSYLPNIYQRQRSLFQFVCWHIQYCASGRFLLLPSVPFQKSVVTADVRIRPRFTVKIQFLCYPLAVWPFDCVKLWWQWSHKCNPAHFMLTIGFCYAFP